MNIKIIYLLLFCSYLTSYSQIGFGIGYESSGNVEYNSAIKINLESLSLSKTNYTGTIIGFGLGINFLENDLTGKGNLNPQEETGNYLYTIITPSFKLGKSLGKSRTYFVAAAGLNFVQEHREYKSSSTGIYSVETDYKKTSPYIRVGFQFKRLFRTAFLNPGIGFGTNGFYINNTFYTAASKIKKGIQNRVGWIEKRKVQYELGGVILVDLKFNDWEGFVDAFKREFKEKGIKFNDKIITKQSKSLQNDVIVKAERNNNNETIISFNKKEWKKTTLDTKLYLLCNQLALSVLNFEIDQGGKMTSKLNQSIEFNWKEFIRDSEEMYTIYDEINNKTEYETRKIQN